MRMGRQTVFATLESGSRSRAIDEGSGWGLTARLVRDAQEGDREAFGRLAEQFERTVYAICLGRLGNASEALEMTQEVFLHALRHLDQLREPERFAGWLKQMTHRMAINRATRRVPPSTIEDEVLQSLGGRREDPLEALIARERAARLWEALEGLKPIDRESLVDFYIQGQSLVQISAGRGLPIGTVKRRLHTARARLKKALQASLEDVEEWVDAPMVEEEDSEVDAWELATL